MAFSHHDFLVAFDVSPSLRKLPPEHIIPHLRCTNLKSSPPHRYHAAAPLCGDGTKPHIDVWGTQPDRNTLPWHFGKVSNVLTFLHFFLLTKAWLFQVEIWVSVLLSSFILPPGRSIQLIYPTRAAEKKRRGGEEELNKQQIQNHGIVSSPLIEGIYI